MRNIYTKNIWWCKIYTLILLRKKYIKNLNDKTIMISSNFFKKMLGLNACEEAIGNDGANSESVNNSN